MIVDDEKHVREGVLLLADWGKHGITETYEARDGEEAVQLILQHKPQIIFTDMRMPKKNGIELLKWLTSMSFNSKTIVISGYEDFDFMRSAILYKSFDYLLKPIDPFALNSAIERAVAEWKEEEQKRKLSLESSRAVKEAKPLYWDHILSEWIVKNIYTADIPVKMKREFGINPAGEKCSVCLIYIKPVAMKMFGGDRDKAFFTLLNICNEALEDAQAGVAFRNTKSENELVLLISERESTAEILKHLYSSIFKAVKMHVTIAAGTNTDCIASGYRHSSAILKKHLLTHVVKSRSFLTTKDISNKPLARLLDYREDIKWAIKSGSIQSLNEVLQKILDKAQASLSLEQIKAWDNELKLLWEHWLQEYEVASDPPAGEDIDYWLEDGTFSAEIFKEVKREQFHQLIQLLLQNRYQKEKNSIQQIKEYVKGNYKEDITLQDIAEKFYLSREYISRRFKQEFGETITDCLLNIRIEKAKELLKNPHLKVYEVAFEVGYQNEKYFSKVFKKQVGLTPNEYRSRLPI
ncbi:response regulator transcription factor [Metabacillus lacus]|nr:helix-turn-helix domain-containing protein [Metabacillus lacus]